MRSPGCGKAATLTSGSRTIQSGGQSRSYILRIPDNYDNSHPYRLIFAYHWNGGTMQDIDGGGTSGAAWSYYGLQAQANNSTIFVAAQGIGNGWANSGDRDLTLTDDMIKLIEGDLCVDTTKVFALGFSYGGGMSYALACARPTVFRAVAVYSGGVAQWVRRRHAARRLHRHSRYQRRNAEHLRRPLDAGQVRHEQRLHPPRPARAESGQLDAHMHHLSGVHVRTSRRVVCIRRWPHARHRGRRR